MEKLILIVLAVTGAFSRCGGDPVPLALPPGDGGTGGSVTTATEDGGEGGASPTTSSTATTGTGGEGGSGGEGGAGGTGGDGGTGGAGGGAPLGTLGAPCDADSECATDKCLFLLPGEQWGVCSNFCDEGASCGEGEACYPAQIDGHLYCWRHCDAPLPCDPGAPGCHNDVDGTNGGYYCLPI